MPAELSLPPDALLAAAADQLVEQSKATGVALTGEGGLLTGLVRQVLQGALESGITDHRAPGRTSIHMARALCGVGFVCWLLDCSLRRFSW